MFIEYDWPKRVNVPILKIKIDPGKPIKRFGVLEH